MLVWDYTVSSSTESKRAVTNREREKKKKRRGCLVHLLQVMLVQSIKLSGPCAILRKSVVKTDAHGNTNVVYSCMHICTQALSFKYMFFWSVQVCMMCSTGRRKDMKAKQTQISDGGGSATIK